MMQTTMNQGGEDPLEEARAFVAKWMTHFGTIQQVLEENAQLKERVAALEAENAVLTDTLEQWKSNDEWSNRVTYDSVIDQIASLEDASKRDDARRMFESLLKKSQVTQFRRDIKKRVKELNEESMNYVEPGVVPAILKSEEAEELMGYLVEAGILNDDWQPIRLSGPERALVAKSVCDRLDIKEVWQVFGQLWNEKPETLRSYLNKALEQKKSLEFQERLKNILD